jgi:hypothetical protein
LDLSNSRARSLLVVALKAQNDPGAVRQKSN